MIKKRIIPLLLATSIFTPVASLTGANDVDIEASPTKIESVEQEENVSEKEKETETRNKEKDTNEEEVQKHLEKIKELEEKKASYEKDIQKREKFIKLINEGLNESEDKESIEIYEKIKKLGDNEKTQLLENCKKSISRNRENIKFYEEIINHDKSSYNGTKCLNFFYKNSVNYKIPKNIKIENIISCDVKVAIALLRQAIKTKDKDLAVKILKSGAYDYEKTKKIARKILRFKQNEEKKDYYTDSTKNWESFSLDDKKQALTKAFDNYTEFLKEEDSNTEIKTKLTIKKSANTSLSGKYNPYHDKVTLDLGSYHLTLHDTFKDSFSALIHERCHEEEQHRKIFNKDLEDDTVMLFALGFKAKAMFDITKEHYNEYSYDEMLPRRMQEIIEEKINPEDLDKHMYSHLFTDDMIENNELDTLNEEWDNLLDYIDTGNYLDDGVMTFDEANQAIKNLKNIANDDENPIQEAVKKVLSKNSNQTIIAEIEKKQ